MAVALDRVSKIVRMPDRPAGHPRAQAAMPESINLRGQAIPVVSLSAVFDLEEGPAGDRKALIVETSSGLAGFAVERISGIRTLAAALQKKTPGPARTGSDRYIAAKADQEGRTISIIDVDALANEFCSSGD